MFVSVICVTGVRERRRGPSFAKAMEGRGCGGRVAHPNKWVALALIEGHPTETYAAIRTG
jgi:hypothetical protein